MPQQGLIYRALIASPGDCVQERKIIPEVIRDWNAVNSLERSAIIEPVLWETHSYPSLGNRPQEVINSQIVRDCDLVIGAFWTKLGTPTGVAASGTAEEIEHFRSSGKPVLLYFSSVPVMPESINREQYSALTEYKESLRNDGLYSTYSDLGNFRELFQKHLALHMIQLLSKNSDEIIEESELEDDTQVTALREFSNEFRVFCKRLRLEWETERDSRPINLDEGRYIINQAISDLIHFSTMISDDSTGVSESIRNSITRFREIERQRLYIDGGQSSRAFWGAGSEVIDVLDGVSEQLNQMVHS